MQLINQKDIKSRSSCSIACTLELIGDKWTLLILRDALFFGKTFFNEFRYSPEKIASNILRDRLERLVKFGIMSKSQNANHKLKFDYILTERGKQLEPILWAIDEWGKEQIEDTSGIQQNIQRLSELKE